MLKQNLLTFLLLGILGIKAQTGMTFPQVSGITLDEKKLSIPVKNNKYSVIAIAFHRDAEDQLKEWLNPLYDNFMVKDKKPGNFDMSDFYDVNFVFIPMINGFKRIADEFKSGTDKRFWQYILDTEKTDIKGLQKSLGVANNKEPYFFVLNKEGKVVAVEHGKFNKAKMSALEDAIE
jgi:hypothetical protein